MPIDKRSGATPASDPVSNAAQVTPDDGNDLTYITSALVIGTGGNVKVNMAGGQLGVVVKAQSGQLLPFRVTRVWATGTTATDIVAVW